MAYIKEAEGFLAKLPSISLEGMEPLAPQGPPKEQVHSVEPQGYKVPLAATFLCRSKRVTCICDTCLPTK